MASLTPQSLDDRGVKVTYRDPMFHGSQLDRATREIVNRRSVRSRRWMVALVVSGVLLQLVALIAQPVPAALGRLGFGIGTAAFIWVFALPRIRRGMWERSWKGRYKEVARCPACQYDLHALAPENDGCTVCPECGGAWRMAARGVSR